MSIFHRTKRDQGRGDQCILIRDRVALMALAPEWNDLWWRARRDYLLTTPEFAAITLRVPPDSRTRKVRAVALRDVTGKLVLLWPFVTYYHHGLRIAEPMASEWGDYSEVLTEDSPAAPERVAAAWAAIRRVVRCDLFWFRFVRDGGRLAPVIDATDAAKFDMGMLTAPEALVGTTTWDEYLASRSSRQRAGYARKRRQLERMGTLAHRVITTPSDAIPVLDWMIEVKKIWLDKSGEPDRIRLLTPEFRQFVHELATVFMPQGRCELHALYLNEQPIAADINLIDKQRTEWYVGSFHPEYERQSPGMILKEHIVQAVINRGLDYDMRLGGGQHKRYWQTREVACSSWRIANSPLGAAYIFGKRLREARQQDPVA